MLVVNRVVLTSKSSCRQGWLHFRISGSERCGHHPGTWPRAQGRRGWRGGEQQWMRGRRWERMCGKAWGSACTGTGYGWTGFRRGCRGSCCMLRCCTLRCWTARLRQPHTPISPPVSTKTNYIITGYITLFFHIISHCQFLFILKYFTNTFSIYLLRISYWISKIV